jgi:DJ-1/PfpI family
LSCLSEILSLEMTIIPHDTHLEVGSLLFEGIDQIDLTGPFEVLSRIPDATYRIYGKTVAPIHDVKGLQLTPDATLADAPPLDVLHVPGGHGQEALMDDAEVLDRIRRWPVLSRAPPHRRRGRRPAMPSKSPPSHQASVTRLPDPHREAIATPPSSCAVATSCHRVRAPLRQTLVVAPRPPDALQP